MTTDSVPTYEIQKAIDAYMVALAHRVMDVFENAPEHATAEDVMPEVFKAVGVLETFTKEKKR